ncbi:hypothetical protein HELRODRAFT_169170 [Helobdella robusta]|uniref:Reverse transcriptase domain-containing protein n=1 Tax=Helobdella robusta TaxID=6412 RepID=T1F1I8_HELRO|nr:hypothetical protein HELRODRAFT_169170 [Helobdella robusta]ESO08358.1 hypothetical protein HELRODRAFT_169170 [Helobdella robusta]
MAYGVVHRVRRSSIKFANKWVLRSALNFVGEGEIVREGGRNLTTRYGDIWEKIGARAAELKALGFRPAHSTETSLLKLHNDIFFSSDNSNLTLLLALDFSSAFDTVDLLFS